MDLKQLRSLIKIVELGNISKAAEQLHVAQPALSAQMQRLEDELQTPLLLRHSRGVEATAAGRLLYTRALEILAQVDAAKLEVMQLQPILTQVLQLGLTPSLMMTLGSEIAVHAKDKLQAVKLILFEDMSHALTNRLVEGSLDIALAYGASEHASYTRQAVRHDQLMLVSLPQAHAPAQISLAQALRKTLVLPEQGDVIRDTVAHCALQQGVTPDVAYEVRAISAIKALVLRGKACTILPYSLVAQEVDSGQLMAQAIEQPILQRTLYFLARKGIAHGESLQTTRQLILELLHRESPIQ